MNTASKSADVKVDSELAGRLKEPFGAGETDQHRAYYIMGLGLSVHISMVLGGIVSLNL